MENEIKQGEILYSHEEGYEEKRYCLGSLILSSGCVGSKPDSKLMVQLGVKKDDDGNVIPDQSNLIDLDALIQTYKDQCGMELAKRLIRIGQATPDDFRDTGKGNYDGTNIPINATDRANAAVLAKNNADAMASELGVTQDMTEDQLTAIIQQYIQNNPDKFKFKESNGGDNQ